MATELIKSLWEYTPRPLRAIIRLPLNIIRRLKWGWNGARVQVGRVSFLVDYSSGTELYRAQAFAELEGDFTSAFSLLAAQSRVILDAGANIGLYSLLGASVNPSSTVYSFEPEPHNQSAIQRNLAKNHIDNVRLMPMALGEEDATLHLELVGLPEIGGGTAHHISAGGRGIEVRVACLDSLIKSGEVTPPQLIKMDIEGFELKAIRGMLGLLGDHKPEILMEIHPDLMAAHGDSPEELDFVLRNLGYTKRLFESVDPTLSRAWYSQA